MNQKKASRLAWGLWTVAAVLAALAFIFLALSRDTPPPAGAFGFRGFSAMFAVAFATVGAFVAARRPSNPIGWILCVTGIGSGLQEFSDQYAIYAVLARPGSLPGGEMAAWIPAWIWIPITGLVTCYVVQLFPTGRPLSPRWRWVLYLAGLGIALPSLALALVPGPLEQFEAVDNPFGVRGLAVEFANSAIGLYMISVLVSAASLIVRFRRSRGDERQQMKWFVSSAAFVAITLSFSFFTNVGFGTIVLDWYDNVVVLSFLTIPAATGIAILRYRLYDIDLVINRAVVYGVLGVLIALVYAGVVVLPVALLGSEAGSYPAFSFIATAVAAIAFQPVRTRAQRLANRIVYGERATPYETMADFSHRMSAAISLEDVLPRVAEAAAKGVGAQRSRVLITLPDGSTREEYWPESSGGMNTFDRKVEVRYRDEVVGEIAVSKAASEPITPAEEKLLIDLASQAGLALSNVRLTEELQARLLEISRQAAELRASRQRIVSAQDEERRRLERDIHDGAQQQLVSMSVKLRLAKQMLERDTAKANEVLDTVITEASDAVENLRDLARGIFPPLLVDEGIVSALKGHISKLDIQASVELSDGFTNSRFDQSVEAAVYFCCLEAMQNATKHAPGSPITLAFAVENSHLEFSVMDRGDGFDASNVVRGSGLQSMTDRIEALGGSLTIESAPGAGTTIRGRIPIEVIVAA